MKGKNFLVQLTHLVVPAIVAKGSNSLRVVVKARGFAGIIEINT
jgi:hypothetical protein